MLFYQSVILKVQNVKFTNVFQTKKTVKNIRIPYLDRFTTLGIFELGDHPITNIQIQL